MTMVNSGLKGLKLKLEIVPFQLYINPYSAGIDFSLAL